MDMMWKWPEPTNKTATVWPQYVNVPMQHLDTDNLHITAVPFPYREFFSVAKACSDALRAAMFINGVSAPGITLDLNHPALLRPENPELPSASDPATVAMANVTLTLFMADDAWSQLLIVTEGLVESTLGAGHLEYTALMRALTVPLAPSGNVALYQAQKHWNDIFSGAHQFSYSHLSFFDEVANRLLTQRHEEQPGANSTNNSSTNSSDSNSPSDVTNIMGTSAPSRSQLELAANTAESNQTLPQLLSRLTLSYDANAIIRVVNQSLPYLISPRDDALCERASLLDAVARGECFPSHWIPPVGRLGEYENPYLALLEANAALCEVQQSRQIYQRRVHYVRERLTTLAKHDPAVAARVKSEYWGGDIREWSSIFDKATHQCRLIDNSLTLQRSILADIAARAQRACTLRDAFRNGLEPLYTQQSAWWNLTGEYSTKRAVVGFVTLPTIPDFCVELHNASATLKTKIDPVNWFRLRQASWGHGFSAPKGWMDRAGFGNGTVDSLVLYNERIPTFKARHAFVDRFRY
ncbi:hypothetical protein B0T25DRAFT_629674 [Lasiosphaeria hispida]|uniref:Uncharacterized protein n=1 Tax=Lasiosphaeria hispida TaxID=260671 RepID=A0AAJ0MIV0_9PEZI|nr:hypothetical protein B0T25DRAFT_629674 [Lasiosphaeria hispida]